MSMSRKRAKVLFTSCMAFLMVLVLSGTSFAATGTKKISATFKNIKITNNGKAIEAEAEPFIYGGKTYVPLRVITQALGVYVDWNSNTNVVTVGGSSATAAQDEVINQKNIQIAQLQAQVEALQAQVKNSSTSSSNSSGSSSSDKDIDKLEKELKDDFDKLEDVKIDEISLSGDKDKVTVTVDVDLGDYDDEWEDLKDSNIKSWVGDLCGDIQDYYDDTEISGKIKDIDSKDTLVTFTKDGSKSLSINYKDDDYRDSDSGGDASDVENDLDGDKYSVDDIDFKITKVDYDKNNEEVTVEMKASNSNAKDDWNDLSNAKIEDEVEDICKDIAEKFIDVDSDVETVKLEAYDSDNASLDDFEYDVDDKKIS